MEWIVNGLAKVNWLIYHYLHLLKRDLAMELEWLLDHMLENFGMHYIKK